MTDLVPSTRLKDRTQSPKHPTHPVGVQTYQVTVEDGNNSKQINLKNLNGKIYRLIEASPNIADANYTVSISDEDGVERYSDATLSKNTIEEQDLMASDVILSGNATLTVSFSTNLSGDTATFDIKFEFGEQIN